MKKYKAYTNLSITVVYDGHPLHIQFDPLSTGQCSVYITDDPKMQKAIEEHSYFKKYIEVEEVKETKPQPAAKAPEKKVVEIQVSGPDDAKDYIADTFGISRTQLRSLDAIKKAAADNNVKFIGLE